MVCVRSLGISNIPKLTEARGVREDNQAFNKDKQAQFSLTPIVFSMIFSKLCSRTVFLLKKF
ncbi:hypothetical protein BpHYR1_054185 [Brachionus plicatilis]|uniref:Uncharacterized protein n=1 Tax=Brachionus plicatilis TaxID=10195 RepID=A0A3M7P3W2_BRAPC|nr:hypothetical protein BpHYR1_054185 [Brachionus plicatilis]